MASNYYPDSIIMRIKWISISALLLTYIGTRLGSSQSDTVACVILCGAYVSIKSGHLAEPGI